MSTLFLWNSLFSTDSLLELIYINFHIYKVLVRLTKAFLKLV